MARARVLIVGAGIAGPAFAHQLARRGFEPTVVELAGEPRSGGSAVVVRGAAIRVAEQMGVVPQLRAAATRTTAIALLDAGGNPILRLPAGSDRAAVEVTRADLSAVLHQAARDDAEFLFGDTVTALRQDAAGVEVTFRRAAPRRFDLVIGADGIHSTVRRLVFGPEHRFSSDLRMFGATVPLAPDAIDDPGTMQLFTAPGRMLAVHPSRTTPLAIFTFRGPRAAGYDRHDIAAGKRIVAGAYAGVGWRAAELVEAYQKHPAPHFDPLSSVRMDSWAHGRVALLGDAASAAALFGDGSSLAITGAHTLAETLAAHPGDHAAAFRAYETRHRRHTDPRQRRVGMLAALMIPRTRTSLAVRNSVARTLGRATRFATRHDASAEVCIH